MSGRGSAGASARAGRVMGGGVWSVERLIPDAVRAWSRQQPLKVRRPRAVRPWQHVLESLGGYLMLAEHLWREPALAGAYNFGPNTHEAATVKEVVNLARAVYGAGEVQWGDDCRGPHEAGWLALEIAKARHGLGFSPRWSLKTSVERTLNWYRQLALGEPAFELCADDLDAFAAQHPKQLG